MCCSLKVLFFSFIVLGACTSYIYYVLTKVPVLPQFEDTWWGIRDSTEEDSIPKPFKINVTDVVLKDLQHRLANSRQFTPPLEGTQQQYGMNTDLLKNIVDFWITKYQWREREKYLNQYPQFTISIQGLKIHYIHVKPTVSKDVKVLPILILHGWPGSVREMYDIIPLLTKTQRGRNFVFEVIVPSLPGYGFSEAAVRPGLGAAQMAVMFKNFMKHIGFTKYYLQGGDWGAVIVQTIATLYPEVILGIHTNLCFVSSPVAILKTMIGSVYPPLVVEQKYENRMYPYEEGIFHTFLLETGYLHIQATKPDTIGVGLNDSPVGLAAYILEKFTTGTNYEWKYLQDGGLTKKFSYTNLLDNVMIYWITSSATTSGRLYSESFNKEILKLPFGRHPIRVPSACARFRHEIIWQSKSILKERFVNLLHLSDFDDGGHFAAFEVPHLFAEDIFSAVEKFIAYENVKKESKEL